MKTQQKLKLGRTLIASEGLPLVKIKDRFKHLFILGSTGSGKTTFFLNLIKNEIDNALIVLDPNGDLAERVAGLAPTDRLVYIDKDHPICFNPLTRNYLNRSENANELIEVINAAVSAVSPEQVAITVLMAKIIRNAIFVFKPEQMNMEYLGKFLDLADERKKVPEKYWQTFDDKDMRGWYINREQVESAKRVSARLSLFYEAEKMKPFILGKNEFNIPEIVKQKKIVIFNLYGFDDELTAFIGCLITNQIKSYYLHQAPKGGAPLYFYCDEYHLFVTTLFSRFLAEARKYDISMNFAGHSMAQVDKKLSTMILANCYVKVVLSCGSEDADLMAKEINVKPEDIRNLKEKEHEAYIGIGKKHHKVLTYPQPDISTYHPNPVLKPPELDFLSHDWIHF